MNDNEEKDLTYEELRARAEKQDRRDRFNRQARFTSEAKGPRGEEKEVSEETLISLGGKKAGAQIVFGPESGTQLIFRPSKGSFEETVIWTVSLKDSISRYDTQRELSKANRGLWDGEKNEPSVAFKAARQLLACDFEVRKLHEKPEIDRGMVSEQLDRVNEQLIMAQDAISLAVEALSKELGGKLQLAFNMLRDDSQWPQDIEKLKKHAMNLAAKLQRPPTKAELRMHYNPSGTLKGFSPLLKHAGLWWLKKAP